MDMRGRCSAGQKVSFAGNFFDEQKQHHVVREETMVVIQTYSCTLIFIHQVTLVKRQRRTFPSSNQAAICQAHTMEASHSPFLLLNLKQGNSENQFLFSGVI